MELTTISSESVTLPHAATNSINSQLQQVPWHSQYLLGVIN